jgi:hypothetical protein
MFRYPILPSIFLAALISAPVGFVNAEGRDPADPRPAGLLIDRQKLLTELDRVNAEIDALKRDNRGFRNDYRLRTRMADAEALARRLTDLDTRLGTTNRGSAGQGRSTWPSAPEASPSDDRADLESKADILSDQSRRLLISADVLAGRVADLQGRQELRRRAGQLERDPFSPLEQAKRRIATGLPNVGQVGSGRNLDAAKGAAGSPAGAVATPGTSPASPPVTGVSAPGASAPGPTVTGGATTDSTSRTPSTVSTSTTAPAALPIGSGSGVENPGSVASQFRGILDAATLAEIRRLEIPGSPAGGLQAMERALAALRTRAAQLAAHATTLRTQAKTTR